MREVQVLVVTVDETKERLVGHFADLLSDRLEVRRRLTEGHPLPDLGKTTEGDLAGLAQECDLFRGVQQSDRIECQMVLMQSDESPLRFFRISAPERDDEQLGEDQKGLPFGGSHAPDCPYRSGGECLCWRSDPDQNPELQG